MCDFMLNVDFYFKREFSGILWIIEELYMEHSTKVSIVTLTIIGTVKI